LVLGILVVMKVRKWVPVLWFIGIGLAVYLFEAWRYDMLDGAFVTYFLSWPTLFLAFFMLTEPFTMPPTKKLQAGYGALVGFLSNTTIFAPFFGMTPELALILGNLAMGPYRVQQKLFLQLKEKRQIAQDTYEFIFKKPTGFSFVAGQYVEWMLPHQSPDDKGVRRYFTIASSPTETDIRAAMKITEKGSSFKKALQSLDVERPVIASQLAGDFVLPKSKTEKLGFIAGGIGITPFRSHIRYMMDSDQTHDTVLYYCNNTVAEIAYQNLFSEAESKIPFRVIHVIAKETVAPPYENGFVTVEVLKRHTPDYLERTWYLSGPPPMVAAYTRLLLGAGVKRKHIVRDFFPGAV
ncbi:MAG TPA: oxidoreductase, partial [Candidatus Paceibacterota bacterium]